MMNVYSIFRDRAHVTDRALGTTHEDALLNLAKRDSTLAPPGIYAVLRRDRSAEMDGKLLYDALRILRLEEVPTPRFKVEVVR